jgi:hypothetical protein
MNSRDRVINAQQSDQDYEADFQGMGPSPDMGLPESNYVPTPVPTDARDRDLQMDQPQLEYNSSFQVGLPPTYPDMTQQTPFFQEFQTGDSTRVPLTGQGMTMAAPSTFYNSEQVTGGTPQFGSMFATGGYQQPSFPNMTIPNYGFSHGGSYRMG